MRLTPAAGLRHLPFFEALGALDRSSGDWASISAGLVTLRLLDLRRAQENGGTEIVAAEIGAVRDAIAAMPGELPARAILVNIVDAATSGPGACSERALPSLLAYGRSLQLDGQWALAADVFESLLEHPASGEQGDIALQAALKCAYCLRTSGRFEEAEAAYDRVLRLARVAEDRTSELFSEIGRANIALQRGNFPRAQTMLDAVIASARDAGSDAALARALHDRGHVAYRRGLREEALDFLHQALLRQSDPTQRDRLLPDIALVLGELGQVAAARDVHLLIEATAQESEVRAMAAINLMELAAMDEDELAFERYRRRLGESSLPPHLAALFRLTASAGFRRFGRLDAARLALADAATIAARHQLNEMSFRIESALQELEPERSRVPATPSPVVEDVHRTVRALREVAAAP